MKKRPFIDLHQDISSNCLILSGKDFFSQNNNHDGRNAINLPVNNQADLPRLKKSGACLIFAASCPFEIKNKKAAIAQEAALATFKQINFYLDLVNKSDELMLVRNRSDYLALKKNRKIGFLLHIEGMDFIDKDFINLKTAYHLGVRSIGLTHNEKNLLAAGAGEKKGSLSKLGRQTLKKAQELGIIVDLAHLNGESFAQALKVISPPFMFSHGGIKNDFDHFRNLSDEQIKKISQKGGLIGVCFAPNLLSDNKMDVIVKIYTHLKKIGGVGCLAIGSDFDGIISKKLVEGLEDVSRVKNLASALAKKGFREKEIEKVFYRNAEERILAYL